MMEHIGLDLRKQDIFLNPDGFHDDPTREFDEEDFFVTNERLYEITKGNIDTILKVLEEEAVSGITNSIL